jgi:cyanate permease
MEESVHFLQNWQDALVFWSFVAVTVLVTWRILVSQPK